MSIKVLKVTASGFRGFRGRIEVPFGSRFTVITGRNGSGKSSICDAVEYVLTGQLRKFDKLSRTQSREAYEYIWWHGPNEPPVREVVLEIQSAAGERIEISRDHRGKLRGLSEDELIELLSNAQSIEDESDVTTIERMVKPSFIRDEFIAELSLDLTERARFDFVQEILGCYDISPHARSLDQAFREVGAELRQLEKTVEELATDLFGARTELTNAKAQSGTEDHREAILDLNRMVGPFDIKEGDVLQVGRSRLTNLGGLINELASINDRLEIAAKEYDGNETAQSIEVAEREQDHLTAELEEVEDKLSEVDDAGDIGTALADLCRVGRHIGRTDSDECPLCGSSVTEEDYFRSIERVEQRVEDLEGLVNRRAELKSRRDAVQSRLRRLRDQAAMNDDRIESLVSTFNELLESTEETPRQVTSRNPSAARQAVLEHIAVLQSQRSRISSLLERLSSYRPPEAIASLEANIDRLEQRIAELDRAKTRKEATRDRLRSLSHTASRLSHQFLDQRLANLDPLLIELYARLKPHASWEDIRYDIRGDVRRSLSLMVTSGSAEVNPSYMFSSGQRRAAGIAFLLAVGIANNWCSLETLFLDDPVQHIDDYRSMHLVETIAACVRGGRQVVCTVEDPALANLLSRRVPRSEDDAIRIDMTLDAEEGANVSNIHQLGRELTAVLESA